MKFNILLPILILTSCNQNMNEKIPPPVCEKHPKVLSIHNDQRTDNYFWLNNRKDSKVIDYLNAENNYTNKVLKETENIQEKLYKELKSRIKKDDKSVPYEWHDYIYWREFKKGNEYPKYWRKKTNGSEDELLIDCNPIAEKYDYFDFGDYDISTNNELMAYSIDTLSRRIYQIHIKNLKTGELYPETLEQTTGSVTWANDNKTLFYVKQDLKTLRSFQIYAHQIGTNQREDVLVYEETDETFYCSVYKSKSENYVIINSSSTLSDEYRIINANEPQNTPILFQKRERGLEYSIYHHNNGFYIVTNQDHKNFSIKFCNENKTDKKNWKTIIEGRDSTLIEGIDVFQDYMIISERKNGLVDLQVIELKNLKSHYIPFDEPTYVVQTTTNLNLNSKKLRFAYTSMINPGSIYEYDLENRETKTLKTKEVLGGYDAEQFISERIWAEVRDGVKVPISIVYKKGIKMDKSNPTLIYAYGSYGYSLDATFSSNRLSLLNRGFVFAIAHIRGGEELGRQWYENGKLLNKKNSFYDFIDCSKALIEKGFCSEKNLYAAGGSAGGLLMGAVINMEPNLYHGVIAHVPFVDVITTMLDETIPLTTGEYDEWGNPNNKDYYDYMKSYSPYDNVEEKNYPNLLVTTGLHDSQVQYWEPAKWVAKLRELKKGENLLLLKTNMNTGHGGASGRFEYLKEIAFDYAFLFKLEGISN